MSAKNVPATERSAIESYLSAARKNWAREKKLTSDELEGLGLHGLIGISFRNGTHFCGSYSINEA